jgi:hypothetical protein
LSDIWNDCCDFCVRVDDTKREVEACTKTTARCNGDTCAMCKACKDFLQSLDFTNALVLAKHRADLKIRIIQKVVD